MENELKYNYDILFDSIKYEGSLAILTEKDNTYYFVPCLRPVEDMNDILHISEELIKKNIANHTFIFNKKKQLITQINEINYVLLKINYLESYEFNLNDITKFNKITELVKNKSKLYRNDWANLWSEKIDYFEYQISEIGKTKKIILNSLGYYIGLAENAIAYVNETNRKFKDFKDLTIVLSRKRIYYPNYSINYLNPLNYIFDLDIRDVAEYIKSMFFSGMDVWHELDNLFKMVRFSSYSIHMLFARLLFPSYYFDIYERVMNQNEDEEQLIPIIERIQDYESFLEEMYYYLTNYAQLMPIEWLIKKEKL